jgi:undecaprenyl phosphate-alpha-L-ara4N flippase subunit ArnF
VRNGHFAIGVTAACCSIGLSALGQLCMKAGMLQAEGGFATLDLQSLASSPAVAWILAGLVAYGFSMLSWLTVLTRFTLSSAYPLLSLSYVLVYVGATHWPRLMETATPTRTLGTLLIAVGVALVARGGTLPAAKTRTPAAREPETLR